jgi:hypothetical protein
MRFALLAACFALACSPPAPAPAPTPAPEAAPAPAPAADHADHAAGAFVAAPAGASVRFTSPADGATVSSPVHLVFAVDGLTVQPAGQLAAGTGHHHVIVDAATTPEGEVVPKDETHIHFGQGQTEADLPLAPGPHRLTLQFADGAHRSYGPALSSSIAITVAP